MQLGAKVTITLIYPIGYIFLFFSFLNLYGDRIDQYYHLYQALEKYQKVLIEKFKDQTLEEDNFLVNQQELNLETNIKTTSEFVTSCIMLSTLQKQPNKIAQGNIVLQAILAAYAMSISFIEFIKYKKEQKKLVENMTYVDIVIKFPHLVLLEYQLKIMKLLLEMNNSISPSERAFARIHLVALRLPKPYEFISKKIAKKIYKKHFNKNGDLVCLQPCSQTKEYKKNLKNITVSLKELVLRSEKISTNFSLLGLSEQGDIFECSMNKKIMQMIEAARIKDFQKLYELKPNILENTLVELYDFLIQQIDSDEMNPIER